MRIACLYEERTCTVIYFLGRALLTCLKKRIMQIWAEPEKNRPARVWQMEGCVYLFFLKFVVDKSKNDMPNDKYVTASVVFLSIKFTIDTIKKHIEANKKHIHLIFSFLSFFMIFPPRSIRSYWSSESNPSSFSSFSFWISSTVFFPVIAL